MVMNTCLNCKYYEASEITELGKCTKYNLNMHCSAINKDCYEKRVDNNDNFIKQCEKILEFKRSSYATADFRKEAKYLISFYMGKLNGAEFNKEQLEILEELTISSINEIIKEEVEVIKYSMIYPKKEDKTKSIIETEKDYRYNNANGVEVSETNVIKKAVAKRKPGTPYLKPDER